MTVRLVNSAAAGTLIQTRYGNTYTVDASGYVSVAPKEVNDLQNAGYTYADQSGTSQPAKNTAITTVGAGTLTAAALIGGVITRSGSTAAYTDTTDTAAIIIAALENPVIGESWEVTIKNTVPFAQTLAGGAGVVLSGQSVIPPNCTGRFLVTYSAAGAMTMQGIAMTSNAPLPDAQYTTAALQSAVLPAANMAGAKQVYFENTGVTPGTLTTDTAVAIVAAIPNAQVGMTYGLKVRNSSSGANTATIAGGAGVTGHGTLTIAQNVTRDFAVVLTSLTAVDIYSMGVSAAAA